MNAPSKTLQTKLTATFRALKKAANSIVSISSRILIVAWPALCFGQHKNNV